MVEFESELQDRMNDCLVQSSERTAGKATTLTLRAIHQLLLLKRKNVSAMGRRHSRTGDREACHAAEPCTMMRSRLAGGSEEMTQPNPMGSKRLHGSSSREGANRRTPDSGTRTRTRRTAALFPVAMSARTTETATEEAEHACAETVY